MVVLDGERVAKALNRLIVWLTSPNHPVKQTSCATFSEANHLWPAIALRLSYVSDNIYRVLREH